MKDFLSDLEARTFFCEKTVDWLNDEMDKVANDIEKFSRKKKLTKSQKSKLDKLIENQKGLLNKSSLEMSIIENIIKEINEYGQEET